MALTDQQMEMLNNNTISKDLLAAIPGLNNDYYLSPLMFIEGLGIKLSCTGQEYRHAVEMAHDEDLCPEDSGLPVIVDGILAFIFADELAKCGINNLTIYFTYRFQPPTQEFQDALKKFDALIRGEN